MFTSPVIPVLDSKKKETCLIFKTYTNADLCACEKKGWTFLHKLIVCLLIFWALLTYASLGHPISGLQVHRTVSLWVRKTVNASR